MKTGGKVDLHLAGRSGGPVTQRALPRKLWVFLAPANPWMWREEMGRGKNQAAWSLVTEFPQWVLCGAVAAAAGGSWAQ